jgi:hypothetical protein
MVCWSCYNMHYREAHAGFGASRARQLHMRARHAHDGILVAKVSCCSHVATEGHATCCFQQRTVRGGKLHAVQRVGAQLDAEFDRRVDSDQAFPPHSSEKCLRPISGSAGPPVTSSEFLQSRPWDLPSQHLTSRHCPGTRKVGHLRKRCYGFDCQERPCLAPAPMQ